MASNVQRFTPGPIPAGLQERWVCTAQTIDKRIPVPAATRVIYVLGCGGGGAGASGTNAGGDGKPGSSGGGGYGALPVAGQLEVQASVPLTVEIGRGGAATPANNARPGAAGLSTTVFVVLPDANQTKVTVFEAPGAPGGQVSGNAQPPVDGMSTGGHGGGRDSRNDGQPGADWKASKGGAAGIRSTTGNDNYGYGGGGGGASYGSGGSGGNGGCDYGSRNAPGAHRTGFPGGSGSAFGSGGGGGGGGGDGGSGSDFTPGGDGGQGADGVLRVYWA